MMREEVDRIFRLPRLLATFPLDSMFCLSVPLVISTGISVLVLVVTLVWSVLQPLSWRFGLVEIILTGVQFLCGNLNTLLQLTLLVLWRRRLSETLHRLSRLLEHANTPGDISKHWLSHLLESYGLCILLYSSFGLGIQGMARSGIMIRDLVNSLINITFMISNVGQFRGLCRLLVVFSRSLSASDLIEESVLYHQRLIDILQDIHHFYSLQFFLSIGWCFIIIIIHLYAILLPMFPDDPNTTRSFWIGILIISYPIVASALVCNEVQQEFLIDSLFMYSIGYQFRALTHTVVSLFRSGLAEEPVTSAVRGCEVLMTLCSTIDRIYGPQMLFVIVRSFVLVTIHFYLVLAEVVTGTVFIVIYMYWVLHFLAPIVIFIISIKETDYEVRRFNECLYWKMVEDDRGDLLRNDRLNFHFIGRNDVTFSACGFFTIDHSLICSMIVGGTTYLVIVLQYGKALRINQSADNYTLPAHTLQDSFSLTNI